MTTVASPPAAPAPRPQPKRRGRYIVAIGGCVVAVVFAYLLDKRYHLLALDEDREEREVEQAIAERVGAVTP